MNWFDFKNANKDLIQANGFLHFSFWLLTFFFLFLIDNQNAPTWFRLIKNLVDVSFYMVICYVNIYILIPEFLQKKKPIVYVLALVLFSVCITAIHLSSGLLLYRDYSEELRMQIIDNKNTRFIITLFIGFGSMLFKVTKDWLLHQQEKADLTNQTLQSELRFLKSQINPHFFFNTLNNLYALTLKKSDLAPEIVLRLSEMMRYMLYESNEKQVSLDKEIKCVTNYLELEKLRQGHKFNINFNIDGEVKNQKIAPLMFIPFLENSFKHGLNNQIKSGFVNIDMQLKNEWVAMEIENSKPPTYAVKKNGKKSGGIGLENVKRRLKLLYPQKHQLNITDNPNSFKVSLNITLI